MVVKITNYRAKIEQIRHVQTRSTVVWEEVEP
jgi:hypothetical protein